MGIGLPGVGASPSAEAPPRRRARNGLGTGRPFRGGPRHHPHGPGPPAPWGISFTSAVCSATSPRIRKMIRTWRATDSTLHPRRSSRTDGSRVAGRRRRRWPASDRSVGGFSLVAMGSFSATQNAACKVIRSIGHEGFVSARKKQAGGADRPPRSRPRAATRACFAAGAAVPPGVSFGGTPITECCPIRLAPCPSPR